MQALLLSGVLGFASGEAVLNGDFPAALDSMRMLVGRGPASASPVADGMRIHAHRAMAQLLLLLGKVSEAEDQFRECIRLIPGTDKATIHSTVSLAAGLQNLWRNQLRSSWSSLQRAMETQDADVTIRVSACGAMAALLFQLGMRRPAAAAARTCSQWIENAPSMGDGPAEVLMVLQVEFRAIDALRQHRALSDMASWPRDDEFAQSGSDPSDVLAELADCRRRVERFSLLTGRIDFLTALLKLGYSNVDTTEAASNHISHMASKGFSYYAHAARHDLALSCIAAGRFDSLQKLMVADDTACRSRAVARPVLEHEYCLAKCGELGGSSDTYIVHYKEYAAQALQQIRKTCAYITIPSELKMQEGSLAKDDFAARLSGRYRRAYQYISSNLHDPELSIRSVALEVGVTERALQLAFKEHLGMSPSAVIRHCRMERIRQDLTLGAVSRGATRLDVAHRWGIKSRSALVHAYRDAFGESPSQTNEAAIGPLDSP